MLALALLLFAGAAPAVDGAAATSALLKGLVADGEPGLAVLVRKSGRTVFERGYGVRDLRSRAPIDARTRFRLGSVTKQMTAAAIMTLVRDGRLGYEDRLTQALPGFPAYGSGVTIRHLLTHTSGLPDYEQLMENAEKGKGTIWTPENQIRDDEVLALLEKETRGLFTPGTSWAYSNSGYVVLGLVAARAAGKPFGEVLRERIFTPLGMTRTLAYEKGKNEVPARAYGHTMEPTGFRETDQSSTSATLGDGGVYSCLEDLAKWDAALRTNALLSKEEMAAALTPVRLSDGSQPRWPAADQGGDNLFPGQPVAYGFGWFLDPWQGRARAWHHGETMGFRSIVERFPADGLSVVVLANRGDIDLKSLALEIAEAQFGGAPRGDAPREDRIPAGGATLYARDVGRGQPIVVLHGGPDFDHTYLLPDLDRLADAFRLIYYDQRGRGKSADGVRAEDVTLASDIADVDKVREHYRLASTAVLGHSYGTLLALEYAIRHPERVSHLILMNPAPASAADYKQFRKERLEKLGADLDRLRAIAATDAYQAGDPDAVAAYYRIHFKAALQRPEDYERLMTLMRPSFTTSEAILKARHVEDRLMDDTWSLDGYDLLPKLRSLKIPTLVIYGDHDFIPSYVAEHIAEALPAARFVTMKDCGHFAYLECPGPVRKEIEGFLRNPAPAPTAHARAAERAVAVTFDDLPAVSAVANDVASLGQLTQRLLESVRKHGIPAVGFVNEGKLFAANAGPNEVEGRTALLRMWLDAGLELGNHSYSHRDLNLMSLDEFEADVIRGESVTRKLLAEKGRKPRYFRHPFLHVGDELSKRRAFEGFLAAHGYTVAPVTVDNDEYVYAAVYADARRRGDAAAAARIGDDYLRYMDEVFSFFEDVARRTAGREIKHVLLLHANSLNAERFGALAEALARRGYRFVSLAEALEDDVYRLPDAFVGAPGNSWLNHWEVTAGRKPVRTPGPPDWIMKASAALPR